jgi:hypothetical protein
MPNISAVVTTARRLNEQKEDEALYVLIGMREKAVANEPALKDDPDLEVVYAEPTMGPLDDIKRLGKRITNRWNKELYAIVCGNADKDEEVRDSLLNSLSLGEAAVIAAVASALIGLGVGAAIAAPLAPLLVRRFIWPAKDELCEAWGEAIEKDS